ncbi:MAG: ATP-binding protein [Vicinamibacterales bacterium]
MTASTPSRTGSTAAATVTAGATATDQVQALEREIATLRVQLRRAQENRANQDAIKARNDRMLHAVITEMEQAQAELVRKNEELHLTQERLQHSEQRARLASRAKSEFLARMSHELRTPLNAIIGYTELLLEDERPERDARDLTRIHASGRHLLALISEVLDMSRIEAGRVELRRDHVTTAVLIAELVAAVEPLVHTRRNRLEIEAPDDLALTTDATRLRQVLLNLLGNAAKFTENGVIRLSVGAAEAGWVRFAVTDTGIGFDQAQLETIFEEFGQLEGVRYGGTGLGLAIARRLCHLLGGTLTGEGRRGEGARFEVRLPCEPVATALPESDRHDADNDPA